ncbi:MAG: 3-isopropylmalate dehydrogenase [Lachnospiraceae bacterium]|nr:3-isopropylmalate dehydrogenase [Lachnospiraceae bacterium]MDY5742053.1 3-isopropylmalate dehydrogenase [Lachnospiraceae bacterium]
MNKIVCLPGDGIGPEIMTAALQVLQKTAEKYFFDYELDIQPFGGAGIDELGDPFAPSVQKKAVAADAVLLGSIGGPQWDMAAKRPEQGLLALRKLLGVYANVRPLTVADSLTHLSPLKKEIVQGTDLVIVRELTGGAYFGEGRYLKEDEALDTMPYSRAEIERILHYAFRLASRRRGLVTSVDKANVLSTSKLWRRIAEEVAAEYPEVKLEHRYVDAMAMELVTRPSRFDVIVTENLFGDILSDEASVLGGSLGLLSSASFGDQGTALYEPAHGSAPDIAGQNIANPIATILSVAMMLRHSFDRADMAEAIETAVDVTLREGKMTKDLNPTEWLPTTEWTAALLTHI